MFSPFSFMAKLYRSKNCKISLGKKKDHNGCVSMQIAGGESSREREAGVGKRTPSGPGDPTLEATQRAG